MLLCKHFLFVQTKLKLAKSAFFSSFVWHFWFNCTGKWNYKICTFYNLFIATRLLSGSKILWSLHLLEFLLLTRLEHSYYFEVNWIELLFYLKSYEIDIMCNPWHICYTSVAKQCISKWFANVQPAQRLQWINNICNSALIASIHRSNAIICAIWYLTPLPSITTLADLMLFFSRF